MVGLKNGHICKISSKTGEPQRYSWGMQKKKKNGEAHRCSWGMQKKKKSMVLFWEQPCGDCWEVGQSTYGPFQAVQWHPKQTLKLNLVYIWVGSSYLISCLSRSLADRWGTTVDFTTSFLHSSRFSAFRNMMFHWRPVHTLMLSSHRFLCLPLRLSHWTVPCRTVLASPDDRVTCPYHFSLRHFTEVKRSSYGPMAFPVLAFISLLVMWSLYEIPRSLRKHLISNACILLSMSAGMIHVSHAYKDVDLARECIIELVISNQRCYL